MSFFKNLFKGNKEQEVKKEQIVPLTNGELVNISQVPDEVFSSKMMGDGFAMKTSDGIIVSPVEGTIVTVFPTKHAVTINSVDGREVLIHLGPQFYQRKPYAYLYMQEPQHSSARTTEVQW